MDAKIAEQILEDLAPTFEALESQSAAILQFLKDKKIANDEQLAPYMEKAAAASSVRWRALRVRMGRLFALAEKSEEEKVAKKEEGASKQGGQSASEQAPVPWNKELAKPAEQSPSSRDEADVPRGEERQPVNEDKERKAAQEKIARKPLARALRK